MNDKHKKAIIQEIKNIKQAVDALYGDVEGGIFDDMDEKYILDNLVKLKEIYSAIDCSFPIS